MLEKQVKKAERYLVEVREMLSEYRIDYEKTPDDHKTTWLANSLRRLAIVYSNRTIKKRAKRGSNPANWR